MKRKDINFGFLWEDKNGAILDAKHPFDEKWAEDYMKYLNYVRNASVEEVFQLIVYTYLDNFPRDYWTAVMSKGMASKYAKQEGSYETIDGKHFIHDAISLYKDIEKEDDEGFSYVFERVFEFNEDIDLKSVVEDVIAEKEYTKDLEGEKITYKIEESPIDTIVITKRYFEMKINSAYYVRRTY